MRTLGVFSFPLRCTVLLLNADPSLLTPGIISLSADLPRWSFLALFHSRASSTSGTDSSAAYPCCVELLTLSFSFSHARPLSVSRFATSYLATALLSARGLHHCIRRLSCSLLEVGLRYVLDLAASHPLVESLQSSARPWPPPETLRHHIDQKFPGCRMSPGTFLL